MSPCFTNDDASSATSPSANALRTRSRCCMSACRSTRNGIGRTRDQTDSGTTPRADARTCFMF
jgi:hypothetical protein